MSSSYGPGLVEPLPLQNLTKKMSIKTNSVAARSSKQAGSLNRLNSGAPEREKHVQARCKFVLVLFHTCHKISPWSGGYSEHDPTEHVLEPEPVRTGCSSRECKLGVFWGEQLTAAPQPRDGGPRLC